LATLATVVPKLIAALEREQKVEPPKPELTESPLESRLTLRMSDLAKLLGVSRRNIERERAAGRIPPPDVKIGRVPLWKIDTITAWLDSGKKRGRV
jgi:predicted DNA-binding transcriptional regulator AlpA